MDVKVVARTGQLSSGSADGTNYPDDVRCVWRVSTTVASPAIIQLVATRVEIEEDYDAVRLFDGPDFDSPEIGLLTGMLRQPLLLHAYSGAVLVEFTSDSAVNAAGTK